MSMFTKSREGIAPNEYYHIYNRGAHKQSICKDKSDRQRLLFSILYLQSSEPLRNVSRITKRFSIETGFPVPASTVESTLRERFVELVAFCMMPNHYHLIVREVKEGGIASYIQRIAGGYTRYFNQKYQSSGHVFQGRYKSVHVQDDRQLVYLSAYIHRNPRELAAWKNKEFEYPWSSLQDYTKANRWGGLIIPDIIATQFGMTRDSNYADFVKTSTAKTLEDELATVI